MNDQMREDFDRAYARDQRRMLGAGGTIPKSITTLACTLLGFAIGVFCVLITVVLTS